MDRGKRREGRELAERIRLLPGTIKVKKYIDWFRLTLNLEYIRIANILDMKDAILLANNKAKMPSDWIDIMTTDEIERAIWKAREFRKTL